MSGRRHGTWRRRVLELALVGLLIVLLVIYGEPLARWFGDVFAEAMQR